MDKYSIPVIFASIFFILYVICVYSYRLGAKVKDKDRDNSENSELISTSIFGLLALFMSFSYSMAVSRYENRRALAVNEANAISTAYLRGTLLKPVPGVNLKGLYIDYVNARISFYENYFSDAGLINTKVIRNKLEEHIRLVTTTDRAALESAYTYAFTEMFDMANSRNYALKKTLPLPIYIIILIFAVSGFAAFNYDRGFKKEKSNWKLTTFIFLFSLLYTLIYDIDHANQGLIRITQDAMIEVRDTIML